MKQSDLDRIRSRLLEERRKRLEKLAEFDERYRERLELGDDDLTNYPLHMADEGTDTMEQEKEFLLASQDGRQSIATERLDLVPWTRLCIECQQQAEAGGTVAEKVS
jgi:RNA polymerase-binding transcription factor DksA